MTAELLDVIALVEPCEFIVEGDLSDNGAWIPVRCGKPAVDDEDEARCAEHLGVEQW